MKHNFIQQSFTVDYQYRVYFTEHIFDPDNSLLADTISQKQHLPKVLFVIDEGVAAFHPYIITQISQYQKSYSPIFTLAGSPLIVAGGEQVKNSTRYFDHILKAIDTAGIDRHSFVIGIGGGAVLDTVGFAATVAHRGIRHIRIPTTVLSQNDSGVGVKNGINFFQKKNYLGTFAPPYAVINDHTFLYTLSDRDWRSGLSEAIKVALIKDQSFFESMEKDGALLNNRQDDAMRRSIFRCAELHVGHIGQGKDPFELGSARPLDFGHWAAHKLEQMTDFAVTHGEAVAIGIALDTTYSYLKEMISYPQMKRVLDLLTLAGLPIWHEQLSYSSRGTFPDLLTGLEEFREHLGGELCITLLNDIGKGVEVNEIDHEAMVAAIYFLETYDTLYPTSTGFA